MRSGQESRTGLWSRVRSRIGGKMSNRKMIATRRKIIVLQNRNRLGQGLLLPELSPLVLVEHRVVAERPLDQIDPIVNFCPQQNFVDQGLQTTTEHVFEAVILQELINDPIPASISGEFLNPDKGMTR